MPSEPNQGAIYIERVIKMENVFKTLIAVGGSAAHFCMGAGRIA